MITLQNFPNSRAFRRMIEKQISRWLHGTHSPQPPRRDQFHALLRREGDGHDVACEVEVIKEDGLWEGRFCAPGPELAVKLALKSMSRRVDGKTPRNIVRLLQPIYANSSR